MIRIGSVVSLAGYTGLKLGVVLGVNGQGYYRVRVWRAASARFTLPQVFAPRDLGPVDMKRSRPRSTARACLMAAHDLAELRDAKAVPAVYLEAEAPVAAPLERTPAPAPGTPKIKIPIGGGKRCGFDHLGGEHGGELFESRRYFADGSSVFVCGNHKAKLVRLFSPYNWIPA